MKNVGPNFFKIIQIQSVSILELSIHASLSCYFISVMLFKSFKWSLQCFILLFWHFGCYYIILRDIAPLMNRLNYPTSVSMRSPNWRTDSSTFAVLNTIPSEDSDLLLKNAILWPFRGLRTDTCDPLDDESDPFLLGSFSSCHQESSQLSLSSLILGASILLSFKRLSSFDTVEG